MLVQVFKRLRSTFSAYWSRSSSPFEIEWRPVTRLAPSSPIVRRAHVPLELVVMVLDELAILKEVDSGRARAPMKAPSFEIRAALSRCALVCRAWRRVAQAHLYRAVVLTGQRAFANFVRAVERNGFLASSVVSLSYVDAISARTSRKAQPKEGCESLLARLLRACKGLERLRLCGTWTTLEPDVLKALSAHENLSALYCCSRASETGIRQWSLCTFLPQRLPVSLKYLYLDSNVSPWAAWLLPPTLDIFEYQLDDFEKEAATSTFFTGLAECLAAGLVAAEGLNLCIHHRSSVPQHLVQRLVADFQAHGVTFAAVRTT